MSKVEEKKIKHIEDDTVFEEFETEGTDTRFSYSDLKVKNIDDYENDENMEKTLRDEIARFKQNKK